MSQVLGDCSELVGIGPYPYAVGIVSSSNTKLTTAQGDCFAMLFEDAFRFDVYKLRFDWCPLAVLRLALAEIHRVTRHDVQAIKYYTEEETVVSYRGNDELLWKRDFIKHSQTQFPDLTLVRGEYWGPAGGFERYHWWLSENRAARGH